jgi:hypothetical protein
MALNKLLESRSLNKEFTDLAKTQAILDRAKQVMDRSLLTPAIREWMVSKGITPEQLMSGQITPEQRAELGRFIVQARGTSEMKNVETMLNDPKLGPEVAMAIDRPKWLESLKIAEKLHPEEAYRGRPDGVNERIANVQRDAMRFFRTSPRTPAATPATPATPAAPSADVVAPPPAAPAAPAAPSQRDVRVVDSGPQSAPGSQSLGLPTEADRERRISTAKELGQTIGKAVGEMPSKIRSLNSTLVHLDRLEALAKDDKTFQGSLAELQKTVGSAFNSLGIPAFTDRVANSEQYMASVAELLKERLASKDYGSGTGVSNLDLIAAGAPLPELTKTAAGRKLIIDALREDSIMARKDMEAARKWYETNNDMAGFRWPSEIRREKLEYTAKKHGISVYEVYRRAKASKIDF